MQKTIPCEITHDKEEVRGELRDCTFAECSECEHITMSEGTGPSSALRCLAMMREECPEGRTDHWYVDEEDA